MIFKGIKSVIYPSLDLEADKAFWSATLGIEPYFEKPFYVGFAVEGCELGLDPNATKEGLTYPVSYWHVANVNKASSRILAAGATFNGEPRDVGGGIVMATFKDKSGNIFGIIDMPAQT